ncbi:MAG TPA: amino acid adenylation domain-containing protein, partial [Pyrinomonadaceae bacterium]
MSSQLILDPDNLSEASPRALTLVDLLRGRAQLQPERPAYTFLIDGEQEELSLTYGELDRQARAIAAWLQPLVSPGDRVLLLYPPGLEYIAAFFGCLYAGAVAVPAYPPRRNRNLLRLQALVADAQASVALTTAPVLARISPLFSQNPYLEPLRWLTSDSITVGIERHWQEPAINSEALAFLQYTSGSTSTPKGVMLTHGNLLHNEQIIQHAFQQSEESIILGWLPLYHDMGLIGNVIQPLYVGAPCVLMSPTAFLQKPVRWLEAISRYRATTSGGPNFAYDLCARKITEEQRATLDLDSWTVAFNGSEPIRQETMERFADTFAPCGFRREAFSPCYGLAEATLIVTGRSDQSLLLVKTIDARALENNLVVEAAAGPSEAAETKAMIGCGTVLMDQQLVIVEPESGRLCPPEQVGEVWIAGPSIAAGYWNRPEETERTFQARLAESGAGPFLRTGDLGFLQDGELYITGRLKDLIIIRGLNHYPQDIELTAERCSPALRPGYGAAFAVEVEGEEKLVLVQEVDHRRRANFSEVIEQIIEAVAEGHEIQVHAVSLIRAGSIPKTSSGKIQRHACRAAFLERSLEVLAEWRSESEMVEESVETAASAAPDTTEGMLGWLKATLAAKLRLNSSRIDVNQPATRYGLDSLLAIELVHQAETVLGIALPLTFFLQNLSLTELVARMLDQYTTASMAAKSKLESSHEAVAVHPLSHGQKALWFLHQIAPASAAYNIVGAVRILSALDTAALKRAFQALVDRHPSLRTTFIAPDGEPVQSIHEKAEVFFEEEDASEWSEELLRRRLSERAHLPFDLQQGLLLRVSLFRRSAQEHVLLLAVHHIVSDIWSLAVLTREVGILYSAEHAGAPVTLDALPLQFSDIVRWEEELLHGPEGERLWTYWQKQLAGELPVLNLPIDHPRPSVQTYRGASVPFKFDAELTRRLKVLSQKNGATLYMTLLAAFQTLLSRYTGQTDILVGSSTANRNWLEMAGIVGYFVNPVVLRGDLSQDPSFESFLSQIRRVVLEAFEHQAYPLPLLVERLQPVRDPSYSPLFQVLFVLQNAHLGDEESLASLALGEEGVRLKLGELEVESVALEQRVAQFDLTIMFAELDGGLTASLQYNTDLFELETIERLASHFEQLLQAIVRQPEQRLSALPLLSEAEEQQLLRAWNSASESFATHCLQDLFAEQVRLQPERIALSSGSEQLSYSELDERANQLAHHLQSLGLGPDSLVGVCLERSMELMVAILAVVKAGAAYLPLEPTAPTQRLAFILEDAEVKLVLTQEHLLERLPMAGGGEANSSAESSSVESFCLDRDWSIISDLSRQTPPHHSTPDNLAYVIYTSGSTGQPKGVEVTHANVTRLFASTAEVFKFTDTDVWTLFHSAAFDFSVWEMWGALVSGGRLVIVPYLVSRSPEDFYHLLCDEQVTVLNQTPTAFAQLDEAEARDSSGKYLSLRVVIFGGEALDVQGLRRWFDRHGDEQPQLVNMYGITETTVHVTYRRLSIRDVELGAGSVIGKALPDLSLTVLDAQQQLVPIGVAGELYVGGAGLARGYLKRAELTSERFIADPFQRECGGARLYRSGDLVKYLADGELEYLGRVDSQVKIRGHRIELGEIEAAINALMGVRQSVVVVRTEERGEQRHEQLVAYLVGTDEERVTTGEVRRQLAARLPEYMLPAVVVQLAELPLTSNGKVDRRRLPEPETSGREVSASSEQARTAIEEVLAGLWSEVLGLEEVGMEENFFELGGHSLLATQLISRVRESVGVEVGLQELFEEPSIRGLGRRVERALRRGAGVELPAVKRVRRGEAVGAAELQPLPLSFSQQRLWFLDQLEPESPFYNIPTAVRMSGMLNLEALERTLNEIVRRHESLRTTFAVTDGKPVQVINETQKISLSVTDLSNVAESEQEEEVKRIATTEARRPFNLSTGPLLRASLLALNPSEHVLLFTLHHI